MKKLLLFLFVTPLELVDTTSSIHQHVLAGIERVRSIRDLQLYQRVLITIFPFDGFF